ncbi:MAG TPA: M2 family metallopeptidase [Hyphomonadaceae bacterium]|nr:M2 family metallopeptidase [Hyphomonadaceae bacterium]HPI48746.1 M2 family metallopeptidase [Hyphomonadaceae bacterium]
MRQILLGGVAAVGLLLAGCNGGSGTTSAAAKTDATTFLASAEKELSEFSDYAARVQWVNANFITDDTDWLAARASSEGTLLSVRLANATKQYEGASLTPDQQRKMQILRAGIVMPAPSSGTPEEQKAIADELSKITTDLQSAYGKGKFTIDGKELNLEQLSEIISSSRDPKKLQQAWEGWQTIAVPMKADYARMVEIGNQGAKELGFSDIADMWLANYDMPSKDMEATVERLWSQVQPLYNDLHCYTRAKLNAKYGDAVQPKTGPIRADLLGNMWAQQWNGIYDIVAPPASNPGYDLNKVLVQKNYDPIKMVKTGEAFFTSLGLAPLPETFWQRSLITRPRDREVVCHASAWDLDNLDDLRIKMCTQVNAEDFSTVHHELGHNFYQRAYNKQDFLFKNGANDGFHEAIGDFVALSITPEYLKQLGLISTSPPASADLGLLMDRALEKIAFLPFGLKVDKWRWQVFRGEVKPEQYNQAWVDLGKQYQGIIPPGERPADAFDPGAKFHIPGNTPYLRYFLSFILQFQFQKAACEQAGWTGPLHRCSIYNNKEVGAKFAKMLEMGASKPWPEALEAFTGTREIDGSALVAYFAPLQAWMKEQNAGQTCGW